jgi:hypothetical protein
MIVEIGPRPYVASVYPDEALFFETERGASQHEGLNVLSSLAALGQALRRPDVDLVVCHPNFSAPWSPRRLGRIIFSRKLLEGRAGFLPAFGPELLRRKPKARLVVIDHEDLPVINRDNLFLLDRCDLYFKRELPPDHWRVLLKTAHPNLPTPRFRLERRHSAWIGKLRPISIGLPTHGRWRTAAPQEKRVDVFFSGRVAGSATLRSRGLAELKALAGQGVTIDAPETPLPPEEFYRRCAAAWLVWSPEGLGWDCFRHYEAPVCGAAPLINTPTIERHQPLRGGEHAVYYDPEPGGLTRAAMAALADKPALARMALAARAHVLAHHTPEALARHVVETARAGGESVPTRQD